MLDRNYTDWRNYLNRLLSADFHEDVDVSEELNRLLLNYLTFAYTIQKHFAVSFRQRFKKQQATLKKYFDFVDRLCAACWPFAFLLDYRGYVQHVGLGISANSRTANDTSVRIKITASSKTLLAESRGWKRSGLTVERGDLDLVAILKEFHVQMIQSYATFVAKTFFPELHPAEEFYASLTREIQERHPNARMIFFTKKPEFTPGDGGKMSLNMNIIMVPNDVFGELGIKIERA
ncbi:MAG TPA: hypothetical protein VJU77_03525 [Chthoniobacterales bacterium]|nr:hypothetical protein [Chthoniobacterales bacterium]